MKKRIRFTISDGNPVIIEQPSDIERAISTLQSVCNDRKIFFTMRYDHYSKVFTVKVLAKSFCSTSIFEAFKKAIFYVAVAEGYVSKEQIDAPLAPHKPTHL